MVFGSPDEHRSLKRRFARKNTDELLDAWKAGIRNRRELLVVFDLLRERGQDPPIVEIEEPGEEHRLPVESNAKVRTFRSGKIEFRFSRDGFMSPGRSQFKSQDDLLSYGAEALGLQRRQDAVRGSVSRKGRYQRVDESGAAIFTFGDPILDLVTNKHGLLVVGDETYDLKTAMLRTKFRRGGLRTCDLGSQAQQAFETRLAAAARGENADMILECGENRTVLASTNPSSQEFKAGGITGRFRAWKTNIVVYWSMGAELETFTGNFTFANIVGRYGDQFMSPHCFVVGIGHDFDAHDDYMDEWEWGILPCSSPYDGVKSHCTALVGGQSLSLVVTKGDCDTFWPS
jgi:hypothetical protein